MHSQKELIFSLAAAAVVAVVLSGCGVKGDPLPPEKPAEIGRGRPTYKRATEDLKIRKTPARKAPGKHPDEEDDDERE